MCEHFNFYVAAKCLRLTDGDDGPVIGFTADLRVFCQDCGMPFSWKGVEWGISNATPRTSIDGTELRAPIEPQPNGIYREKRKP
jgi:hypothetical protein